MQEDALFVQQTLKDDRQAFHRLIMKYYNAIYTMILSWVRDPEDAKDLTQEVFLKAYQELATLRHPEQFRAWLRQIAKNLCQDWQRKRREVFVPIDDDMISETPSADETLILQETLAKVMKAINELPEDESRILKERYLDSASYDELESRYGLSQSVLAMRLHRARQKVREQVAKMLSGIAIFSWQDALKKIIVGGVEAVKITAKVKLIAIGIGAALILGGTGIILWYHQQPEQTISEPAISQTAQKTSVVSSTKSVSDKKDMSDKQNLKDNKNEDTQKEQAIAFLDSLEKNSQEKATVKGVSEVKKDADPERKIMLMSVEEAHKKGAELKVELNSWLSEAVDLGDVILASVDNAAKISDPVAQEAAVQSSRQLSLRQIELIKKIARWEITYTILAEDPDALKPGGWIYEQKIKIRPGSVIWSYPVE